MEMHEQKMQGRKKELSARRGRRRVSSETTREAARPWEPENPRQGTLHRPSVNPTPVGPPARRKYLESATLGETQDSLQERSRVEKDGCEHEWLASRTCIRCGKTDEYARRMEVRD